MIISHSHRFIFFAVPRTATHSLRQALHPHLDESDWEQKLLFGERFIPVPEIAAVRHGHVTYRQLRDSPAAEYLETYFKFGFVRNPYDRFLSVCFFLNRRNPGFRVNEIQYMKQALGREPFRQRILVAPQHQLLAGEDDKIMVDYVGRYETLQESYQEICRRIGIPAAVLPRANRAQRGGCAAYYDEELKQMVSEFYRLDFKLFGYDPDSVPGT